MKHCWGLNAVSRLGPLYSLITCGTLIMHQSYKCRGAGYCHTARAILSIIDEVCVSKYIINLPVRTTYLPLEVSYIATSSSFCFVRSIYSIHCMPAKMKKHPWLVGKKAHTVSVILNLCTYIWSIKCNWKKTELHSITDSYEMNLLSLISLWLYINYLIITKCTVIPKPKLFRKLNAPCLTWRDTNGTNRHCQAPSELRPRGRRRRLSAWGLPRARSCPSRQFVLTERVWEWPLRPSLHLHDCMHAPGAES